MNWGKTLDMKWNEVPEGCVYYDTEAGPAIDLPGPGKPQTFVFHENGQSCYQVHPEAMWPGATMTREEWFRWWETGWSKYDGGQHGSLPGIGDRRGGPNPYIAIRAAAEPAG